MRTCLAILLVSQCTLFAQEPDFCLHLLRCKQSISLIEPANSIAFLRPYPLTTASINLPRDGQSLIQTLATEEGIARVIDQRLWLRANATVSSKEIDHSRRPFILNSQTNADGVLIVRGNIAFAFPRFLLLNPIAQQISIQDGDFVATFRSRYADENTAGRDSDAVWQFLFNHEQLNRPAKISITAVGSQPGAVAQFLADFKDRAKLGEAAWDLLFAPNLFELSLYASQPEDALDQRMFMVTRLRRGFVIHYLIPFKESGALGSAGKLLKSARIESTAQEDWWEHQTRGFRETLMQDGDQVSVVKLSTAVALF